MNVIGRKRYKVLLLSMTTGLTGCLYSTHQVQKVQQQAPGVYKTATLEELEKTVSDRDQSIQTMSASVMVTASTGGAKEGQVKEYTSFKGFIYIRKPQDMRLLMQLPVLGSRALDMVGDANGFTLMRTSTHGDVWVQGSNTVTKPSTNNLENLRPPVFFESLLVPGVGVDEFVTLTESTRVVQAETKHSDAIEEPDYDLTVLKKLTGNMLRQERVVHFSRVTMLPFEQDIYDDSGRVVTVATYDGYQAFGTIQFPTVINIKRPLEEYALKLDVTKLQLNEKLEDDQFELKVPAGVSVQKLE